MKSILDHERNFIELYAHHLGESEVPEAYHDWACLSLMAACVADRVWIEKFRGSRLSPNLYVFLIGPSALGKGAAIDEAQKFVQGLRRLNVYRGRATAQHLYDFLGRPDKSTGVIAHPKVWLIHDELAADVGEGGQASSFVKIMTKLYSGTDTPIREGTRTRGGLTVIGHNINWTACTTEDWMVETVPKSSVVGGFFGRVVPVKGQYNFAKRLRRPIYPPDYDEVVTYLRERVLELSYIEGPFVQTDDAVEIEDAWYMNRPAPTDEALMATWKREHDLTLKLAMLFSLADSLSLVIHKHHMIAAQRATAQVMHSMPSLVSAASTTNETMGIEYVANILQARKAMAHSALINLCYKRGINSERLKGIMETLLQGKRVTWYNSPLGGRAYAWGGKRKIEDSDDTED